MGQVEFQTKEKREGGAEREGEHMFVQMELVVLQGEGQLSSIMLTPVSQVSAYCYLVALCVYKGKDVNTFSVFNHFVMYCHIIIS